MKMSTSASQMSSPCPDCISRNYHYFTHEILLAARNGHLECLDRAYVRAPVDIRKLLLERALVLCFPESSLTCIYYLREHVDPRTMPNLIHFGACYGWPHPEDHLRQLECLRYCKIQGFPWSNWVCLYLSDDCLVRCIFSYSEIVGFICQNCRELLPQRVDAVKELTTRVPRVIASLICDFACHIIK